MATHRKKKSFLLLACLLFLSPVLFAKPIHVEVVKTQDDGFVLMRGDKPYTVKGAGVDGADLKTLAAHGANSIRTWSVDGGVYPASVLLDKAHELGMTVSLGIDFARERHGFDYNDPVAVAEQLEQVKAQVIKHKDHPALLTWFIGNELNFDFTNPKVYDAVNQVAEMIKQLDPHHPTTTTLAGFDEDAMDAITQRAPALDFISFQLYADVVNLPKYVKSYGYEGPYMITEWGAVGHWEVYKTKWNAPVETTSSEKASNYAKSYLKAIQPEAKQVIGNYVFLWGQKQERTGTWYGMFLDSGERTEAVDVMHYIWTGQWPANRTPRVSPIGLDGKVAFDNIYLFMGDEYEATLNAVDPDNDKLSFKWEIRKESTATEVGGDKEEIPELVEGLIEDASVQKIKFKAPNTPGAYRLYAYVYDGNGNAAHANIPFFVK
ncbi:glycoside hydrolase family 2 TIM barrel-domain containing protein [Alteromonas hispanica]|uniref:Glycoside hydrolase family 2 catalytic domain-containing protein n=1 Tax=Alteromonas hispanica TaxID=315421 RepID=A0A6L9MY93_9ALTE|nr:hypothetical protein [Alteromonas hispanica]